MNTAIGFTRPETLQRPRITGCRVIFIKDPGAETSRGTKPDSKGKYMALIQCAECSGTVAESAEFCPKCGNKNKPPKPRNWVDTLIAAIPGSIIISTATAILAYLTFFYQKETQENEKLQAMIESAVSDNAAKERTAIQVVSYLAKESKLSPKFALSILGTVVRNGGDEKLRGEVYDAVQNLTEEGSPNSLKFDKYEQLEVFCLRAALTPVQNQRQTNIRKIEEFVRKVQPKDSVANANETSGGLKLQGASKLLSLTQHLSDPQTVIDLLLSVCACDSDPDMIEKVIPNLCKAIKLRDHFGNESNQDVLGFLELVIPISTTQLR
jgi:RNA polymerase subunit RPABC4/transcription elongation factor Spt4